MKFKEIHSGQVFALDARKRHEYLTINEAWSRIESENRLSPAGEDACILLDNAEGITPCTLRHIAVGEVVYFPSECGEVVYFPSECGEPAWWAARRIA
jgi:hypothetical protein